MNKNQQEIATEMILFLKSNDNKVLRHDFINNFDIDPVNRMYILRSLKDEYKLLKIENELYSLTKKGVEFISFNEIFEVEKLEKEKLKTDLELAKKTLKEFPRTKLFAWIGFITGTCLAILEIIKLLGLLNLR